MLDQQDVRSLFERQGEGAWTLLYDHVWETDRNSGLYCALAQPAFREKVLNSSSWDLRVTDGAPGFTQSWSEGRDVTTYLPVPSARDGVEPLVLVREYYGVAPAEVEIDQQFRLFHNMRFEAATGTYWKMQEDGARFAAIKIEGSRVLARSPYLKQYLAARQMDLVIFMDSKAWSTEAPDSTNSLEFRTDTYTGRLDYLEAWHASSERHGSRYLAKKVIPAGPVETCGIWPYEAEDSHYPEFIIGEDEHGRPRKFSCEPDRLANFFGANSGAPHYLSPVHFRREVLAKYYDNPELYEVADGRLRCASLWSVQIDNDLEDRVVVFLGDLGRDLPASERDHWRAYMVPPDAPISDTNARRSFLAQATDPQSLDLRFRRAYRQASRAWEAAKGWVLFREPVGADVHLLQQVRIPLNSSQNEFEEAIKLLAKLMSDSLNEKEILTRLPSRIENEKGISKLERYLRQEGYPEVERDIAYLRRVQELRSKVAAHLKGSDYEKSLTRLLGSDRGEQAIRILLRDGLTFLESIVLWLHTRQESPSG